MVCFSLYYLRVLAERCSIDFLRGFGSGIRSYGHYFPYIISDLRICTFYDHIYHATLNRLLSYKKEVCTFT
jgi:hypothetical protein